MQPAPSPTTTGAMRALPLIAALAALAGFFALEWVAYQIAGVFEYPLDDPYIHLAMAEGIARGTYGVNPGEAASAASSILYPFLLVPFLGTPLAMFAPLIVNGVMVTLAGALWGGALRAGGFGGVFGGLAALIGPLALNMPGVAFTGMEHEAHLVVSMVVLLGLHRLLRTGHLAWWLGVAMVLAPLIRLEGLALTGLALIVLLAGGRATAVLAISGACFVTLGGFMAYLSHLGLPPLPGSVMAKLSLGTDPTASLPARIVDVLMRNLDHKSGLLLGALVLLAAILPLYAKRLRAPYEGPARTGGNRAVVLRVAAMAGLAHLMFGQIGWLDRYEHYSIVILVAALALSMAELGRADHRRMALVLTIAMGLSAACYAPGLIAESISSPKSIHLQQAQMARLAHGLGEPVAVNDLGRVVLGNPNYVLDIFGLGNFEALTARQNSVDKGWLAPLLVTHNIRLAMVYEHWFGKEMAAAEWVRIGTLMRDEGRANTLGAPEVAFYSRPDAAAEMVQKIELWAKGLPATAQFKLGARDGDGAVLRGE